MDEVEVGGFLLSFIIRESNNKRKYKEKRKPHVSMDG